MRKFILLVFSTSMLCMHAFSQLNQSGRGMYVDRFFRTALNPAGQTVINPAFSILGIPAKEDSLLRYACENHFTYLILYDLYYVVGNQAYENLLCSFVDKAKNQYCIEYIGVASSCIGLFDNIFTVNATEAISFSDPDYSHYSQSMQAELEVVEEQYTPSDSLFFTSEVTKLAMRVASFNLACNNKLDVLVTEYEFWNATVDDCVGDLPSRDQKYVRYQDLITNMDLIRDLYNAQSATHKLYVESYLGYLHLNTAYSHQTIANWIDGSYNGKRRIDRLLNHYYGSDPSKLYSRTATGWNNTGYYLNRFLDFCQSTTTNQTVILPIFSSEYIPWGAGGSFLGSWFNQAVSNNIFSVEKTFYNDWYDDAQNYHQSTVGSATLGNVVKPGRSVWFTSSQMEGHIDDPILFTSNSPVCVASGQNGTFQFQYQGPIEQGVSFKFYITNAGNMTLRCGSLNSIPWPVYNPSTQTSIDLNAALGSCSLPVGEYDAHLELKYSANCPDYIVPLVRVSVTNSGKIVALTPTTVCQGHSLYLKASTTQGVNTTYAWYDGSTPIAGATSATYAPASATGVHNYSCLITSSVSGCSANRSNVIPVTINTFPAASISQASSSSCSVTLQASPSSAEYVWHDGSRGSTYTTSIPGSYSVAVTKNGCESLSPNFNVAAISGTGSVVPALTISSNKGTGICSGTTVTFSASPANGGTSPNYQWKKNGVNTGTNSSTYTVSNLNNNDVITCVMTSNLSCASPLTATSNPITMVVSNNVTPTVSVSQSTGTAICTGTNVTFTASPVNGGTNPSYQWKVNGNNVGTNSNTYSNNALSNNSVISCVMTSSTTCVTTSNATSNSVIMTVNAYVAPAVSISSNLGLTVCAGTSVTFNAAPVNGGGAPTYQWKKNGNNVGSNSPAYTTGSLNNSDVISCVMTSNLQCVSPATATSNNVTMVVNPTLTPSVSVSSGSGTSICSGANVVFSATPVNGGGTPVYQWKKNGSSVGSNSNTYSTGSINNNDVISCVMTSNASCLSTGTATSNNITMTVAQNLAASVSITVSPGNNVCAGTGVTFSAAAFNGGSSPVYQWKKNGLQVGTNSINYTDNLISNGNVITCEMTSNATCAVPLLSVSNSLPIAVNPVIIPAVSITSNYGNQICQGTNVIFTATHSNGGAPPAFAWEINGVAAGSNSSTFICDSLENNDVVTCRMTSTAYCASPSSVTSAGIQMIVHNTGSPIVSITSNAGTAICAGTVAAFEANVQNAGTAPVYQWMRNGGNVGTNSSNYSSSSLSNNDVITCSVTSSSSCAAGAVSVSNNIVMTVNSNLNSSVSINSDFTGAVCSGTQITFNAIPVNGGSNPAYQWKRNGNNVGTNSPVYTTGSLGNGDQIVCEMTGSLACSSPATVTSNSISLNISPCVELNLRLFIQGFYRQNNTMIAVADPVNHPTLCDTVTVELRSSISPYNIVYTVKDTIDINGNGRFFFPPGALNNSYYIVVHHRNSLETWSNTVFNFNNGTLSYDFTPTPNRAYGTNLVSLGDGNFGLWSGDVTDGTTFGVRDGIINEADYLMINQSLQQFVAGYVITDITGDRVVESADFSLLEVNFIQAVAKSRP